MIPPRFFYYWSGSDFQYVHYLSVKSLLKTTALDHVIIYYEQPPQNNEYFQELDKLRNVTLKKVDYDFLIGETGFSVSDFNTFFKFAEINHKSDFIRYLVLYQGGVYLDFDTLVLRDLSPLLSVDFFVAHQEPDPGGNDVNGAIMGAAPLCHEILYCLEYTKGIKKHLKRFQLKNLRYGKLPQFFWGMNALHWCDVGPALLTKLCKKEDFCGHIYPKSYFYFFSYEQCSEIFDENLWQGKSIPEDIYILHYWGSQCTNFTRKIDRQYLHKSSSIFAQVARSSLGKSL